MAYNLRSTKIDKSLIKDIKPIKIEIKDIPQIIEIYKSFWGTTDIFPVAEFKKVIKQNLCYAYKVYEEIIGFCLVEYLTKDNIAEIDLLCIRKKYQKNNLGDSLLSFCINNCCNLNIKKFNLYVSTKNIPAFNLYKKQGFTIKSTIKNYYHEKNIGNNDAYNMILDKT